MLTRSSVGLREVSPSDSSQQTCFLHLVLELGREGSVGKKRRLYVGNIRRTHETPPKLLVRALGCWCMGSVYPSYDTTTQGDIQPWRSTVLAVVLQHALTKRLTGPHLMYYMFICGSGKSIYIPGKYIYVYISVALVHNFLTQFSSIFCSKHT